MIMKRAWVEMKRDWDRGMEGKRDWDRKMKRKETRIYEKIGRGTGIKL